MSEPQEPGAMSGASFQIVPDAEIGDTPALYSNFVQATVTPLDLTLHFGWYALPPLTEPPDDVVQVPVRPIVKVSIPLALVGGVIKLLQAQLESWQAAFGQAPPDQPQARSEQASSEVEG